MLHPHANTAHHVVFPSLVDLSSGFIPYDDDEEEEEGEAEEEEETYDDIEGVTGPPPPRPGAGQALPSGKHGGVSDIEDEDYNDIYEVLPGTA